jgi:hypothetical protein
MSCSIFPNSEMLSALKSEVWLYNILQLTGNLETIMCISNPVSNLNFSNGFKREISLDFRTLIVTLVKFPLHLPFCPVTHCVYLKICSMLEAQFVSVLFGDLTERQIFQCVQIFYHIPVLTKCILHSIM